MTKVILAHYWIIADHCMSDDMLLYEILLIILTYGIMSGVIVVVVKIVSE